MRGVKPASAALRAKQTTAPKQPTAPNKNPAALACCLDDGVIFCGSYRDRTDDIHGVNVALYQLS